MTTFIQRIDEPGTGPAVAVKDIIDVRGMPTTAGCRALARRAEASAQDAPVVAAVRRAGGRLVGKANLHELALGGSGENPWYGTPVNPLDPTRVPGGSSSGSAVAVATGEADVALGTDTTGSVRIPSACCGTVGLKTTFGRLPVDGVHPLAPSLDTVGVMAADVAGAVLAMQLLEPGLEPTGPPDRIGRIRGVPARDPALDRAIDTVLAAAPVDVIEVDLPEWLDAALPALSLLVAEGHESNEELLASDPDGIGDDVRARLELGRQLRGGATGEARRAADSLRAALDRAFRLAPVLALPTLTVEPIGLGEDDTPLALLTAPVNLAGGPALSLPVPRPSRLPASLQLVGPHDAEELLLAAGLLLEQAAGTVPGAVGG